MKFAAASLIVLAGIASTASAAYVLVDDFEASASGSVNGQNSWVADTNVGNTLYAVVTDPTDGTNQVLQLGNPGSDKKARKPLGVANAIADGTTGTLFFRVNFQKSGTTLNANFGLTHNDSPAGTGDFTIQLPLDNNGKLKAKDGGSTVDLANGSATANVLGVWYNLWVVVNHSTDAYRVFVQSDGDADLAVQTELFSTSDPLGFRANPGINSIDNLFIQSSQGFVYWDDFYVDNTGMNLANPTIAIPEPASMALLGLGGLMMIRRRR